MKRALGNLLPIQRVTDFGVFAGIVAGPNRRERGAALGWAVERFRRRIGDETNLAIRAFSEARAVFGAAKRAVHAMKSTTGTLLARESS